ncbi:lytic murein transglycosylase [Tistlia consotensis]|uniref:lytic murein transglycosylase n=1 Tax=Tistlia consotensis TaxID=1321365 RepID=UPI000B780FD9|nr:lytic murein transglycosylase [Tistlia consotensis]
MRSSLRLLLSAALLLGLPACASQSIAASDAGASAPATGAAPSAQERQAFATWLTALKQEALAKGISQATLDAAFAGIDAPLEQVIDLDRKQPEFTLTFWGYFKRAVSDQRVATGQQLYAQYRPLLDRIEAQYGVPGRFLIAFWGLETNYGQNFGSYSVVHALATLAFDERRGDFFRSELLTALRILQHGDIQPARMEGSWAGAMGNLQFMPSTFEAHAVDFDGDGRRDIWGSLPDVFASAAHFLQDLGWKRGQTWGREVLLPKGFDYSLSSIDTYPENKLPLSQWATLGVRRADGGPLPQGPGISDMKAALLLPAGYDGPAFLVYENYERILDWNRSILYALAVGVLADRIEGDPPLVAQPSTVDQRLSRDEVTELQGHLARLGFDVGRPDGRVGPQTRGAIRAYQKSRGYPPDALADPTLLNRLRADS